MLRGQWHEYEHCEQLGLPADWDGLEAYKTFPAPAKATKIVMRALKVVVGILYQRRRHAQLQGLPAGP